MGMKKVDNIDTKDSSNMWCDVLGFWDATHFCNNFMLPKRRFWKVGWTFQKEFSKHFSTIRGPNRVLTSLEKCFENYFWNVYSAYQNLRLGGVNFARWLQKILAKCHALRCVGFSGMLLSFVKPLQHDTNDSSNMWCDVLVFWVAYYLL